MKIAGTCLKTKHLQWQIQHFSGGGGECGKRGMPQSIILAIFSRKLHETEKNWTGVPSAPLNL